MNSKLQEEVNANLNEQMKAFDQLREQIVLLVQKKQQVLKTPESTKSTSRLVEQKYVFSFADNKNKPASPDVDCHCDSKIMNKLLETKIFDLNLKHKSEMKEMMDQVKIAKKKAYDQKVLLDMSVGYLEKYQNKETEYFRSRSKEREKRNMLEQNSKSRKSSVGSVKDVFKGWLQREKPMDEYGGYE